MLTEALARVNGFTARLMPIGVFAIVAVAAGAIGPPTRSGSNRPRIVAAVRPPTSAHVRSAAPNGFLTGP